MGSEPGSDLEAARVIYARERARRVVEDGVDQYRHAEGDLVRYDAWPVASRIAAEPRQVTTDVAIVGGGLGGLLAGARLHDLGINDVTIVDRATDFGGTWFYNRYPGAMCDVESYVYLPLLEETGHLPSQKYATAQEIFAHCQRIGRHYGLYDNAVLGAAVTEARWNDDTLQWQLETDRGDRVTAACIVLATGPLHKPKLPGIDGIETYQGHAFHTSRWDHAYTGGDPDDPDATLDGLAGRRVGVVGTGASAVQCIPLIADRADRLFVFQRTPSPVEHRENVPTELALPHERPPGWQRARVENFSRLLSGVFEAEDLVSDGWTDIAERRWLLSLLARSRGADEAGLREAAELADLHKMSELRAWIDQIVTDPVTAEALKPYYRPFCKRPCFHSRWYETFNRRHVTLVDASRTPIERITAGGVVVDGSEIELDCLVFATGFAVGIDFTERCGFEVFGRGGLALSDKWAHGARTLHGIHTRGFPNLFLLGNVQSGQAVNFIHTLDEQARHIAYLIDQAKVRNSVIEAGEKAENDWVETVLRAADDQLDFLEACTPGYLNHEGRLRRRSLQNRSYAGGAVEFIDLLRRSRASGDLPGLELSAGGR